MIKKAFTILSLASITLPACNQHSKTETNNDNIDQPINTRDTTSIIGTWVQPNPINESEVQGFKLNVDSTASSINMATLLYRHWWKENDSLALVSESLGNGVSGTDTIYYKIVNLNDSTLELLRGTYIDKYNRQ